MSATPIHLHFPIFLFFLKHANSHPRISSINVISPDSTNTSDPLETTAPSNSITLTNQFDAHSLSSGQSTHGNSLSGYKDRCTFQFCAKHLIEKSKELSRQASEGTLEEEEKLSKFERDHLLRYHSSLPVRLKSLAPGLIVEYSRCLDVDMKYQCCCGKTFLPRSSVPRHFDKCESARSMSIYPQLKYRGFVVLESSLVQPDIFLDDTDESETEIDSKGRCSKGNHNNRYIQHRHELAIAIVHFIHQLTVDPFVISYTKPLAQLTTEINELFHSLSGLLVSQTKHSEELLISRISVADHRIRQTEELMQQRIKQTDDLRERQLFSQDSRMSMLERRLFQLEQYLWNQENSLPAGSKRRFFTDTSPTVHLTNPNISGPSDWGQSATLTGHSSV